VGRKLGEMVVYRHLTEFDKRQLEYKKRQRKDADFRRKSRREMLSLVDRVRILETQIEDLQRVLKVVDDTMMPFRVIG
jgi:hypothetical protein